MPRSIASVSRRSPYKLLRWRPKFAYRQSTRKAREASVAVAMIKVMNNCVKKVRLTSQTYAGMFEIDATHGRLQGY